MEFYFLNKPWWCAVQEEVTELHQDDTIHSNTVMDSETEAQTRA